jgi:hypothetical protein
VSIAHFSPRFFISRKWWIRYLRGRWLRSTGVLGVEGVLGVDGVEAAPAGSDEVLAVGCARRAARCEEDGSVGTWLGASCWTPARRRAPSGLFSPALGAGLLTGALLSYSADGSDGYPLDAVGAGPAAGAGELHPVGALAAGRVCAGPPEEDPAGFDGLCDASLPPCPLPPCPLLPCPLPLSPLLPWPLPLSPLLLSPLFS